VPQDQFDHKYTEYWNRTVSEAIAKGVPSGEQAEATVEILLGDLSLRFPKALDVGCGSGRMQGVLGRFSETTWGVEAEGTAAESALSTGYQAVWHGPAESVPCQSDFFDLVFCWAVFEILDQPAALLEFNRILQLGGVALITGKNNHYLADDAEAYAAENGARDKGFVQTFTDVRALRDQLSDFGLEYMSGISFARRGDFAQLRYSSLESLAPSDRFYEFAIAVRKVSPPAADAQSYNDWASDCSLNFSEGMDTSRKGSQ
jgi:SAM-dependent methyltransferase